jgi:hypothetical protein
MKEIKKLIKTLNNKYLIILLISLIFTISCNNNRNNFLYSDSNNSDYYDIKYHVNKIIIFKHSVFENNKHIDTCTLYKKKDQFYQFNKGATNDGYFLIMSVKKDTIIKYKNMGTDFLYKISKIDKNNFKAESIALNKSKFRSIYYYNKNYRIYKIEEYYYEINNKFNHEIFRLR